MLRGKQVMLRPFRDSDLDALYPIWADFDSWAARSPRPPQPLTRSAFRDWYLPVTSTLDGVEFGVEFVVEVDGEVIGRCGMFNEDPLARHATRRHWRRTARWALSPKASCANTRTPTASTSTRS